MTDPEIIRWLAEKVMGRHVQPRWGVRLKPDEYRVVNDLVYLDDNVKAYPWNWDPLTDARATEEVMKALLAKEYNWTICPCSTVISGLTSEGSSVEKEWKRAFCLAAVKATGGQT